MITYLATDDISDFQFQLEIANKSIGAQADWFFRVKPREICNLLVRTSI